MTAPTIKELSRSHEWPVVMHPSYDPRILADWLDDHGRPDLAILARAHREPDEWGNTGHPESDQDSHQLAFPTWSEREGFHSSGIDPVWSHNLYDKTVPRPGGSVEMPHVTTVIGPRGEGTNRVFESPLTREQFRQFLVHAHRTGLYDTKTLKKWAAHGIAHGWLDQKLKLARHKDVLRSKEFWGLLAAHARDPRNDLPRLALADWLDDRGDPRGIIVRHASPGPFETHHPDDALPDSENYLWYGPHGYIPAPEGFKINAHSGVRGGHTTIRTQPDGSGGGEYRPAAMWQMHVPRTVSGDGRSRHVEFHAPLTFEQAEQFVGMIPQGARKPWSAWLAALHKYRKGNAIVGHGDEREKLARKQPEPQQSLAGATAERTSAQTAQRAELARTVLREAGLTPAAVRQVLAHEGKAGLRAAVLSMIAKNVHPARARYAAAWYGLLSGERRLTVFHPHPKGEDLVHVLSLPAVESDQVAGYMQQAGVPRFVVDPEHRRAYVFDPGGKFTDTMKRVAGGLSGSHSAVRGFGYRLGAGEGSDADTGAAGGATARADYRSTIRDYERSAGIGGDS